MRENDRQRVLIREKPERKYFPLSALPIVSLGSLYIISLSSEIEINNGNARRRVRK